MNLENITIGEIGVALTVIVGIGGGLKYILAPIINYNLQQKSIEDRIKKNEQKLDNDNIRLNTLENDTKEILLSVNALLSHSINGNDTAKLLKRKEELDGYLISR